MTMTSLRKPRGDSLKPYCGHGSEKALGEICPRLLSGISLQTRRYLTVTNTVKIPEEDMTGSSSFFHRHGSTKSKSTATSREVLVEPRKKSLNESALLILCDKVYSKSIAN